MSKELTIGDHVKQASQFVVLKTNDIAKIEYKDIESGEFYDTRDKALAAKIQALTTNAQVEIWYQVGDDWFKDGADNAAIIPVKKYTIDNITDLRDAWQIFKDNYLRAHPEEHALFWGMSRFFELDIAHIGVWQTIGPDLYQCPLCGHVSNKLFTFCPHCGSKLEKSHDGVEKNNSFGIFEDFYRGSYHVPYKQSKSDTIKECLTFGVTEEDLENYKQSGTDPLKALNDITEGLDMEPIEEVVVKEAPEPTKVYENTTVDTKLNENIIKLNMRRGGGKTTALVYMSAASHKHIIAATKLSAKFVEEKAKTLGVSIPKVYCVSDFKNTSAAGVDFINGVYVDELDWCLQEFLGPKVPIAGFTITTND